MDWINASFNPCFTGTSSHTKNTPFPQISLSEFQSLFYWNLLSYERNDCHKYPWMFVSILVLLEPPLIPTAAILLSRRPWVSILVLLEPPLIQLIFRMLSKRPLRFNPCFTGTSSHTRLTIPEIIEAMKFQSLFYWNLLSYNKRRSEV